MNSRFDFIAYKFPEIASLGKKAEECLYYDCNLCLLNLGRLAEAIIDSICTYYNIIHDKSIHELAKRNIISENIACKLNTLLDIKHDASDKNYNSPMACRRLMDTACELCKYFLDEYGHSKFDFLGDLFHPSESSFPLNIIAEAGRDAERNLYSNPRYCLICLGDIGEFIVDTLMNMQDIYIHEKDQLYRINMLNYRGIIGKQQRDTLHFLRMARNKAVHQKYASLEDGKKLLDAALELCEWMFRVTLSDGDIVRGTISTVEEDGLTVEIGRLCGQVPRSELPIDEDTNIRDCYKPGERKNFRVTDSNAEVFALSILQVHNDPWNGAMRHYDRYTVGQDVNAAVKSITESFGAFVELRGGLGARIPESEYSITAKFPTPKVGQQILARIKWLNPRQYPYMLLSIRDIETEKGAAVPDRLPDDDFPEPQTKPGKKTQKKAAERDRVFLEMCKNAPIEEISAALEKGADVQTRNKNKMTTLMIAAMYNDQPEVIDALVEQGAELNAQNHKGNTALIFAAMMNNPKVVRALLNHGANIEIANHDRKKALHYARSNPRLKKDAELLGLLGAADEEQIEQIPAAAAEPLPEEGETLTPEQEEESRRAHMMILQRDFLKICRSGTEEEIVQAVEAGVNLNVKNKAGATGLMFAAQSNTADAIEILVKAGADVNAQDVHGNTALIYAASYNDEAAVDVLLEGGADIAIKNNEGYTASDYVGRNYRISDIDTVRNLVNVE